MLLESLGKTARPSRLKIMTLFGAGGVVEMRLGCCTFLDVHFFYQQLVDLLYPTDKKTFAGSACRAFQKHALQECVLFVSYEVKVRHRLFPPEDTRGMVSGVVHQIESDLIVPQ